MPRPRSKSELLEATESTYVALIALVDSFSVDDLDASFPFEHRDRNVRDVLAHLHSWHRLFLAWHKDGMSGRQPKMPAPGFTWKTTPALNQQIWEDAQDVPLTEMRRRLGRSHRQLLRLITSYTDGELFEKRRYAWTGSTSLGSYITSACPSHYNWALKVLRRFAKSRP